MTDAQKEINRAFQLLSSIPVTGDAIDLASAARGHLKTAYQLAGEPEAAEKSEVGGDG